MTIARIARWISTEPHLCAVRDGVVAALPLVLVSSVLLLVAQPPWPPLAARLAPHIGPVLAAARAINGGLAIYVAFACAQSLARRREIEPLGPALTAVAALLLAAAPLEEARFPLERLNQNGLFAGLLLGLASAELASWSHRRGFWFHLPPGAPAAVERSFAALVPTVLLLTAVLGLRLLGLDLLGACARLAHPLFGVAESYGGILAICLIDAGLYYFGIHPSGVLAALQPLWLTMLTENQAVRMAGGTVLPHLATREFFLWFVWQGGSGGTLAFSLALLFARARSLSAVGRVAFLPSLFNINEPLLFGVPVVLNPALLVPFLVGPLVSASVAYGVFTLGWVQRPAYEVLWTLPAPLGAALACADPRAVVLELFTLTLSALLWWPFVRKLDRERLATEALPVDAPAT